MPTVLGLITARGGSKGIPGKNLVDLAGKPLIAWTVEAALRAQLLDRVVVSTDDERIAACCRGCGAEVPFLRPTELAQDDSPHVDVVLHALDWLDANDGSGFSHVMLLQPTSPFRASVDIDDAIRLADETGVSGVVAVCEAHSHPYLCRHLTEDGTLEDMVPVPEGYLRRQALPPAFMVNGAIYLVRTEVLRNEKSFLPEGAHAYVMPPERSLDIDTPWDLHVSDLIMRDRLESRS